MGVCCHRSHQPVLATCMKDPNTSTTTLLTFSRNADLHILVHDEQSRVITDEKLHLSLTEPTVGFSQINLMGKQKVWSSGDFQTGCILPGIDIRGRHKVCQDMLFLESFQGLVLAGVMDGHGPKGEGVVAFCKRFVIDYFHTKISQAENDPQKFLTEMTEDCDRRLKVIGSGVDCLASGTTAVFLLHCNDTLYFSSVGDSRGILATTHPPNVLAATQPPRGDDKAILADIKRRRSVAPEIELTAVQMTVDQKPEDPQELARITSCGGVVMRLEDENGKRVGPYRVWKVEGMYPGIAMSRSLGDKLAHDIGVISTPIVTSREMKEGEDFFLVLGSDGLWDMMENQEVCDFVEAYRLKSARNMQVPKFVETIDPFNVCIAHLLCEEARARWLSIVEAEDVNIDDISCLVIELQTHLPSKKRAPPRLVEPHKDISDVPGLEKGLRRSGSQFKDPLRQPTLKEEDGTVKEDLETQAAVQIRDPRRSSVSDLLATNKIASESESEESDDAPVIKQKARRWIEEDDEDEDEKRVVRSAKEKRWGAMQVIAKDIKNHTKILDFVSMLSDFEALTKEMSKAQSVIQTEGVPAFYLRAIVRLEDAVAGVTSEVKKKMNSNNNKSFTKLKTQLKKQNVGYEERLEMFRKNPIASEESESEEEEKRPKKGARDDDDDDEEWEGDSEEEEDEEDDREYDPSNPRAYWTIKESREKDKGDDEPKKRKTPKPRPKVESEDRKEEEEKTVVYTPQIIEAKLKEIAEFRGKKSVNFKDIHDILVEMLQSSTTPALKVEILLQIIPTIFDLSRNMPSIVMPRETWISAVGKLREFLDLYLTHPELFTGDFQHRFQALQVGLSHFNERLNEELKKALRVCDPHSTEYAERLRDSHVLNSLVHLSYMFFREQGDGPNEARMALLLLEFSYYVHDSVREAMKQRYTGSETCLFFQIPDSRAEIDRLAEVVQRHGDEKSKAQATMMHCYHHAVHYRHAEARKLFETMSPPETLSSDPMSQALHNRTLVKVGISGFCTGAIGDAFYYLNDIVSTRRLRELLAQVGSGSKEKSQLQDREEKRRMVPFHMHINEDMVEAMYLISAMIEDLPRIVANPLDVNKVVSSKLLRKLLDQQEKQGYFGPPESTKDFITSACGSLRSGDWEQAWSTLRVLDFWRLVPDAESVQRIIEEKIKEAALVVHVLSYSEFYVSFSKRMLSSMFGLSESQVFTSLSSLVFSKQLNGYWDGDTLVLDSSTSTRLHYLAVQLASKTTQVLEINEKLLEYRGVATALLGEQKRA